MNGLIHSIQTLGTVDGPGVRCVVFLQGCPLRCICCHNPDTQAFSGGQSVDVYTLADQLTRYRNYWGKDGGVTVSGGEPLAQARFCLELFKELHSRGIHTALDTSGCYLNDSVRELLNYTDLVLLDYKYSNETDYRRYTGGSLLQTEAFLQACNDSDIPVWLRRVIIPGINDTPDETWSLKEIAAQYPVVKKIELLPFRKMCIPKYEALGIPFPLRDTPEPSPLLMDKLNQILSE